MLRLRRYRVFLFFAAVFVFLVVRLSRRNDWARSELGQFTSHRNSNGHGGKPLEAVREKSIPFTPIPPKAPNLQAQWTAPPGYEKDPIATHPPKTKVDSQSPKSEQPPPEAVPDEEVPIGRSQPHVHPPETGQNILQDKPTQVHWQKQPERYPVPAESLIHLPTGKPVKIPKIQHKFDDETTDAKISRQKRQAIVKKEFQKAWKGYKKYAWMHDELSPVSGKFRDPFCGWAATLVDTLDTLWIMGLEDEFEEAVKAVELIDFTTSPRQDIPMFETTIRYLGGLVAAFDVSGGKYKSLLTKAVELAEILIGAFDTPNRMPVLYYKWAPDFAAAPQRANSRSNLAELGSLCMEFTRLAQLTKDPRYYDAVARVTNALSEWQDRGTSLGGVFPENVDASGCNRTRLPPDLSTESSSDPVTLPEGVTRVNPQQPVAEKPDVLLGQPSRIEGWDETHPNPKGAQPAKGATKEKRQLNMVEKEATIEKRTPPTPTQVDPYADCKPQGLDSTGADKYSMGGGQDSTYEYFPKQHLLLGGLESVYSKMYDKTMEAIKKHMLYRPMLPDNRDVLFTGSLQMYSYVQANIPELTTEIEHLTCFIGGMVGMAAKIFDRKGDLEMAKKLTEGCVWAYETSVTGVMPEGGHLFPCDNMDKCTWDEKAYHLKLDPQGERRDQVVAEYKKNKAAREEESKLEIERAAASDRILVAKIHAEQEAAAGLRKRDKEAEDGKTPFRKRETTGSSVEKKFQKTEEELESVALAGRQAEKPIAPSMPPVDPSMPLTHKEFVKSRIEQEGLPPGFVDIRSRQYILRPEAIESVWYMYRITGETKWQEKGWKMFESIIKATQTEFGHSAIMDVTQSPPYPTDSMESFWLAETLKYFYLLYSTPDTISLDEWVLNTEAHPFKRPV
ncbi:hypothetical protein HYFRA_00008644 [Hymenoscyphus fraxineus]|uniref:alpha-1,2-Mannosidase n=1 Tax=Hymenoscyphus fraxineus TaxID=746836 RepID=A0A9N9KVA5_9HELO|nr:hypothetical protein HYFRA_00008644 [Hymenoscyphus fraxineus]